MVTDIFFADRSEQRISNRMREDVRVRVSVESMRVRNLDATENEFAALRQSMRVVTDAAANRAHHNGKAIRPLDATMLYLSFISVRRCHFDYTAGGFYQNPARGDVPQTDSVFDVNIDAATGEISHFQRSASH